MNINSFWNKFDLFINEIKVNVNVLLLRETKLDDKFPTGQSKTLGFAFSYGRGRKQLNEGFMVFIKEYILGKILCIEKDPVKVISIESNSCEKRWLLS